MDESGNVSAIHCETPLADNRAWERFLVVDAENGEIALYNAFHMRFLRMDEAANVNGFGGVPPSPPNLPHNWACERFQVVEGGGSNMSEVAIYSKNNRKFMQIEEKCVSGVKSITVSNDLPSMQGFLLHECEPFKGQPPTLPPTLVQVCLIMMKYLM